MKVKKIDNTYVLRLEIGDEIIDSIKTLCKQEGITAGTVQGIGAEADPRSLQGAVRGEYVPENCRLLYG